MYSKEILSTKTTWKKVFFLSFCGRKSEQMKFFNLVFSLLKKMKLMNQFSFQSRTTLIYIILAIFFPLVFIFHSFLFINWSKTIKEERKNGMNLLISILIFTWIDKINFVHFSFDKIKCLVFIWRHSLFLFISLISFLGFGLWSCLWYF